jgi:hypothetical protein
MLAVSLDGHQTTQTTRLSNSDYELTYAKLIKELESKINTLPSILKKIILDSHILFDPTREVKVPLFALF